MESIPRKPLRTAVYRSLVLLGLTCLLGTADARPMPLPSERLYPRPLAGDYARGPGLPHAEQNLRLQSGSGTQIVQQSRRISPVLYIGREALDELARGSSRRTACADQAGCFKISHCRTIIEAGSARRTAAHQLRKGLPKESC